MKILFSLLLAVLLLSLNLFSQPSLELVWEKNIFPTQIEFAKFSKDGNYIYCAIGNNIQVMDATTGEFVGSFDNTGIIHALSDFQISNNGETISTALLGEGAAIWDTKQKKIIRKFKPDSTINNESSWIECTSVYPNGKFALFGQITFGNKPTSDAKTSIIVYDIEQGKEVQRIQQSDRIDKIQISHDGRFFVTGSTVKNFDNTFNDQLILWDAVTMQQISVLESKNTGTSSGGYSHIKFSNDDKFVGSLTRMPRVAKIFNINTSLVVLTSDVSMSSQNFEFLPDSNSIGFSYDYLDIFNLTDFKNIGRLIQYCWGITSSISTKQVFVYGNDTVFLYKQTITGINESVKQNTNIQIDIINNFPVVLVTDPTLKKIDISISDLRGNIVYNKTINNDISINKLEINCYLPSGFYICKIKSGNKEFTQKFEIVR